MLYHLIFFLIICAAPQGLNSDGFNEVFGWKQIEFNDINPSQPISQSYNGNKGTIIFPNYRPKYRFKRDENRMTSRDQPVNITSRWNINTPSNTDNYIAYNNVPMGVSQFRGKLFITVPRRRPGIPSTLNYINLRDPQISSSPKLTAYPNAQVNSISENPVKDVNKIISVYRTSIDSCQRLWFIDTGMLEYPDNRIQVQEPSIWVINLMDNQIIHRFEIPTSIVQEGRGLASITIDINQSDCGRAFAYIPDLLNNQLYVYSLGENRIWAFSHNYFNFDPLAGDLSIGGQNFRWDDGIFSIALGRISANGERIVFFHPMASNNEFIVSNKVLQNSTNAERSVHGRDFQVLGSRGFQRQSTMHEFDPRTGVLFYAEIQRNGVGCWNTNLPFSADNHGTVATDELRMIYPSDLTIDDDGFIWLMTNKLPVYIYSQLDPNVVNFRVWKQSVYQAIENTNCKLR